MRASSTADGFLALLRSEATTCCCILPEQARNVFAASSSTPCLSMYYSTPHLWDSQIFAVAMRELTTAEGFRALVKSVSMTLLASAHPPRDT